MKHIKYQGRQAVVLDDRTIVDAITGGLLGYATDALMGSGDNMDGLVLGAIGGALGFGVAGGIVGGLLGGLFDD